jgi:hypothetical protein
VRLTRSALRVDNDKFAVADLVHVGEHQPLATIAWIDNPDACEHLLCGTRLS